MVAREVVIKVPAPFELVLDLTIQIFWLLHFRTPFFFRASPNFWIASTSSCSLSSN